MGIMEEKMEAIHLGFRIQALGCRALKCGRAPSKGGRGGTHRV